MGLTGISVWQLLIILVIVMLLFGTKKLRNLGGDLGTAIKNFRSSMKSAEAGDEDAAEREKIEQGIGSETPHDGMKAKDKA